ncbi:MAG: CotH kinase family protein, partial [Acidobacteria bacterium]|nr:CotH kinase family protein [Acidobacteriota bacterium]
MTNRTACGAALVVAAALLFGSSAARAACDPSVELVISEFMAANDHTLADDDGEFTDWIEIYNPCLPAIDLTGWSLTDDPSDLAKWRFPAVTLERGDSLLVFASGKNRAVAGQVLHTSFKLDAGGEYLALVKPDGVTIAHEFAPQYPAQVSDTSYGFEQSAAQHLAKGSMAAWHVPVADDAALGVEWTAAPFDDGSWPTGPTGLGFTGNASTGLTTTWFKANTTVGDLATAEAVIDDPALQSSVATEIAPVVNYLNTGSAARYAGDRPFPGTTIGVDANDFVVLVTGTVIIPTAGPWTFGVNSDDGFHLQLTREPEAFESSFPGLRGASDTLATFDISAPGAYQLRLVMYERGGGSELELFAAPGTHASWSAAAFDLVGDTANGGLSVNGLASEIGTDTGAAMRGINASLWSRLEFEVADPAAVGLLVLRMEYEDGFVAFLNGQEVAARNAPAPLAWDAAATADRPIESVTMLERFDLTGSVGLLQPGTNVLALHGLNDAASDPDFLVLPDLQSIGAAFDPAAPRFFTTPTPGRINRYPGYPGVSAVPLFSHPSATFTSNFSLTLSTLAPDGVIRYTTNGSDPTETNGTIYSAPLAITNSTRVRARVFQPGLAPGPVVSRLYAKLDPSVLTFSSNLPIVVVHTFGSGIAQDWLTETLTSVIDTTAGRATITDQPDFVGPAGIRIRGSSSTQFPKKQYALETWDDDRKDREVAFLDLPPESDWILYAPYSEKALIQNALAYGWYRATGRYAVRTRFCEMYLRTGTGAVTSSDYAGIYVVMEKIKQGPDRVNIAELLPGDETAPAVTGGYIFKKDRLDPGDLGFVTSHGQKLAYVDPKEVEITTAQAAWLKNFLDTFEAVLYGPDFTDPATGYAAYIDPLSFVDHHILVELTKNIDGFRLSSFFFKDRLGKLNMGPIWDYNLSLGNANYLGGWMPDGWYHDLINDTD